jgi:hypothetical protein
MLFKEEFFLDGDGGSALCETVQDSWLVCLTWSAILVLARAVSDKETLVEKHSKTHTTPVEQKKTVHQNTFKLVLCTGRRLDMLLVGRLIVKSICRNTPVDVTLTKIKLAEQNLKEI